MDDVRVVPTREEHIEGFHRAVDVVARERRYLGFVEAPPLEASRTFVRFLLAGGGVQLVALDAAGAVIGWCDVVRNHREGFRHAGQLGMGLLPAYRDRGIGRRLAISTIHAAWKAGVERIELEVFASNQRAIALYEKLGFAREGVKRRAWKLDGRYDDNVLMALLSPDAGPSAL